MPREDHPSEAPWLSLQWVRSRGTQVRLRRLPVASTRSEHLFAGAGSAGSANTRPKLTEAHWPGDHAVACAQSAGCHKGKRSAAKVLPIDFLQQSAFTGAQQTASTDGVLSDLLHIFSMTCFEYPSIFVRSCHALRNSKVTPSAQFQTCKCQAE